MKRHNQIRALIVSAIIGLMGIIFAGQGLYLSLKAEVAQHLLQQAWIKSKATGQAIPPWPWADTAPLARIHFVNQKQSFIIMAGSSGRTLAFAPGHLSGSALPGNPGHTIISAHRDTHFSILEQLQLDDMLLIETINNTKSYYKINTINVVDTRIEALLLQPEAGLLTLITCYPFDAINAGSPFRYRVDAVKMLSISDNLG